MIVIQGGAGEDGAMGMESGACDRGGTVLVEEARVRFEGGEIGAVEVEGFDFVAGSSAT